MKSENNLCNKITNKNYQILIFANKIKEKILETENINLFKQITTIQDIIREDVDKIQQNQLLTKIWMEEQVQNIGRSFISRSEPAPDPLFSLANADILTNLQILQSTLQGLRRMADTLQSSINIVKANLTNLTNITK